MRSPTRNTPNAGPSKQTPGAPGGDEGAPPPRRRLTEALRRGAVVLLVLATFGLPAACRGNGDATLEGRIIDVQLGLRRDDAALKAFALSVNDPASPDYGRYVSVAAAGGRFGASRGALGRVLEALRRRGLRPVVGPGRGYVEVRVPASAVQKLLGVSLVTGESAVGGRYVTAKGKPRLPRDLARDVVEVVGLTQSLSPLAPTPTAPVPRPPPSECARTKDAMAAIDARYGLDVLGAGTAEAGRGARVALLAIEAFDASEQGSLDQVAACLGTTAPRPRVTNVHEHRGLNEVAEIDLDLGLLAATLPGLAGIDVIVFDSFDWIGAPFAAALKLHQKTPIDAISTSVSFCEGDVSAADASLAENVLALAAASGITVVAAAGDRGSSGCYPPEKSRHAQYPASSAFATGVGGTQSGALDLSDETVWSNPGRDLAGGGGPSRFLRTPPYARAAAPGRDRSTPDLSAVADPGELPPLPFCGHEGRCPWRRVGGTSASAPLVAAGFVLARQAARARGLTPPGLWNPLLYRSAADPVAVRDVVQGDNDVFSVGCCRAGPGYDQASGLGTPYFPALADALAARRAPAPH